MSKTIQEIGEEMLSNAAQVVITSIDEDGYPRPFPMNKVTNEGIKVIYFASGNNTEKAAHYRKNPKSGVTVYNGCDSMSLVGVMEICEDRETLDRLWNDQYNIYFPGGKTDPTYCILKFTTHKVLYYIKHQAIRERIE